MSKPLYGLFIITLLAPLPNYAATNNALNSSRIGSTINIFATESCARRNVTPQQNYKEPDLLRLNFRGLSKLAGDSARCSFNIPITIAPNEKLERIFFTTELVTSGETTLSRSYSLTSNLSFSARNTFTNEGDPQKMQLATDNFLVGKSAQTCGQRYTLKIGLTAQAIQDKMALTTHSLQIYTRPCTVIRPLRPR